MVQDVTHRQLIDLEKKKISSDPIYFMRKHCKIEHPKKGRIPFHLYPFQEDTLDQISKNRYNIILKSRQTGISTLAAGYALWQMMRNDNFKVLVIATKQTVAKNIVQKVKVMHQFLPSWLKQDHQTVENNKLQITLENGSFIKAVPATKDAGRSEALSLLIIDEAAFINGIDEIWTAAQQTLSTGGDCIILSTPNGTGNLFHKLWEQAEQGQIIEDLDRFNPIKIHWTAHPERDQKWRDSQTLLLGERMAAQECVDGNTLITIRNKDTLEIETITMNELYGRLNV